MIEDNKTYTETEIITMFQNDTSLNEEFKSIVLTQVNATLQAMVNCVREKDSTMKVSNPYGDIWVEAHNRFVELYQKYHP